MQNPWNNREITSQCQKTQAEREHKFVTKRSLSERLNDQVDVFLKRGGVIKILPPCVAQLDPITNKPLLRSVK